MRRNPKYIAALLAGVLLFLCTACAQQAQESAVPPRPVGQTEKEPELGLLGFEEPITDGFAFEIMPDADDNIYEMIVDYRLGDEAYGSEVMAPADGGYFGIKNVVMKAFRISDLTDSDTVPPMTLSFVFRDKNGVETKADNEYTVESPQVEGTYLVRITGNQEDGYHLSDM